MTLTEWWAEFDAKLVESRRLEEQAAKGRKGLASVPDHKWAEAIRQHKEKRAQNG